jgi:hypothetical protein
MTTFRSRNSLWSVRDMYRRVSSREKTQRVCWRWHACSSQEVGRRRVAQACRGWPASKGGRGEEGGVTVLATPSSVDGRAHELSCVRERIWLVASAAGAQACGSEFGALRRRRLRRRGPAAVAVAEARGRGERLVSSSDYGTICEIIIVGCD